MVTRGLVFAVCAFLAFSSAGLARAEQPSYPPGTYSVPDDLPYGTYVAHNVEGVWPGCTYGTYTADGTPIDAYNGSMQPWIFARIYSPAIATFVSGDGCTPWEMVGT